MPAIPGLEQYRLAWSDEFDGSELDQSKWTAVLAWRRNGRSSPSAVVVRDGMVRLRTYTEGGIHYTGFLQTEGKFETTYGYFEARIRFNESPGEWCSFWLESSSNGIPMGDPGRAGAEIDVVEHKVVDEAVKDVSNVVVMTLNWDGYGPDHKFLQQWFVPAPGIPPLYGHWHVYGVLWTESGYTFYLDSAPIWSTTTAVSHRDEYILLTCEVSDYSWAGTVPPGGYKDQATSITSVDVDWVRVWRPQ